MTATVTPQDQTQMPQEKPSTKKSQGLLAPIKAVIRPLPYLSLGLHSLLLVVPLLGANKPEIPDQKETQITITQLFSAKLLLNLSQQENKAGDDAVARGDTTAGSDKPPPENPTQAPSPSPGSESPAPNPELSTDYSPDMCGFGDVLGVLVSGVPTPDDFRMPGLYYDDGGAFKPIVGDMVKINRYARGDSQGRDFNSIKDRLEAACKSRGTTFAFQQDLGDGQLFVLSRGSARAYISLVRGGDITNPITIVVAWNGDPTKP